MIGLTFKCSETEESFGVLLEREFNKYKIIKIKKLSAEDNNFKAFPLSPKSINFSGFFCPCCGYGKESEEVRYVLCGRCNEYFCGATSRESDSVFEFKCPCGYSGEAILGSSHSRSFIATNKESADI